MFLRMSNREMCPRPFGIFMQQIGALMLPAVTSKSNLHMTAVSVGICDQSCHATLTLYPPLISSAQDWQACHTILLISSAKRLQGGRITTTARTQIDVDPDRTEAASLRRWVQLDNCPTNEVFPKYLFDVKAVETSPCRLQFTLASLHSCVDAVPTQVYSGYLSVILAELHLVSLYSTQRVFSMECCGMPIYGNKLTGTCRQCGLELGLRINPNVVGEIADETGAICSGSAPNLTGNSVYEPQIRRKHSKILWSDEAWTNLLGRTVEEFAECVSRGQIELLQALEYRLLYMRVIMMIGWTGEYGGGRLAILRTVQ